MNYVILVAGMGTRFGYNINKCLVKINGLTIIEKLINQINNYDNEAQIYIVAGYNYDNIYKCIEKFLSKNVFILNNLKYKVDQNLYSAYLGVKNVNKECFIIEGDCIFDEESIKAIIYSPDKNIIFTKNNAKIDLMNSIIKVDNGICTKWIHGEREEQLVIDNYFDMAGVVKISSNYIFKFKKQLKDNIKYCSKKYYFQPLVENIQNIEILNISLINYNCYTFNTYQAFDEICEKIK